MRIIALAFILVSCVSPFSNPVKNTYEGYVIKRGHNYSQHRKIWPVNSNTLHFDFRFLGDVIDKMPLDSAIQKLYGLSDNFSSHSANSARLGWRVRPNATIDIFAYWRNDHHFKYQWLTNIDVETEHSCIIEIRHDAYWFTVDNLSTFRAPRVKHSKHGFKYRLFPYYEDGNGNGAPCDMTIYIFEYK